MIIQVENAFDREVCENLIRLYETHKQCTDVSDYSGHPVVYWTHVENAPMATALFQHLVGVCGRQIWRRLLPHQAVFLETAILSAMDVGGKHPRHADNSAENALGAWIPNHTPDRAISAICYLNSDFEGGELTFEQHALTIKPRRGLLVMFPSTAGYVHEVLPVKSGRRYTASLWFTGKHDHALIAFNETLNTSSRTRTFLRWLFRLRPGHPKKPTNPKSR